LVTLRIIEPVLTSDGLTLGWKLSKDFRIASQHFILVIKRITRVVNDLREESFVKHIMSDVQALDRAVFSEDLVVK
jgi:hypothetical protein